MTEAISSEARSSRGLRVLIIGNSDGIGLALTRRLLASGHLVTGVSRSRSPIATEPRYEHLVADVREPGYPLSLRELSQRRGPFALCVYCAGIGEPFNPTDLDGEAEIFRVNLVGAVLTLAAVVPEMLSAGDGHFVALSSIGDEVLSPHAPSYAASKAGLSSYLAGVALALRPRGVAVSNVRLGFVDTKMAKSYRRPLMMSVEKAVDVIVRCLDTRGPRVTHPLTMALLVKLLRLAARLKLAMPFRRPKRQSPPDSPVHTESRR